MMDVSWSATPHPEAFKRPSTTTDTLTRLASFIARAESKPGLSRNHRPPAPPRPASPFPCGECDQGFAYGTELLLHQDSCLPKPHKCPRCTQEFSLKSSLQMHSCEFFLGQTSGSPIYATSLTNICGNPMIYSPFTQPNAMPDAFACAPCGKGFVQKQALLHHQQTGCDAAPSPRHLDDPESPGAADSLFLISEEDDSSSSSSPSSNSSESVCKFCARTFRNEVEFHHHKRTQRCDEEETRRRKSKKGTFSCRSCDMVFNCTAKLYHHRKERHSRGAMAFPTEPKPCVTRKKHKRPSNRNYTCQICSAVFLHHLSLWAHSRRHPANVDGKTATAPKNATEARQAEKPDVEKKVAPLKITFRKSVWTKDVSLGKKVAVIKLHKIPKFTTTFAPPLPQRQVLPAKEEEREEEEEEEVEFPCPSCPEVFSRLSDLRSHSELHQAAVRRGKCSVCSCEMDSSKWAGAKRLRLYHCTLCQRGFSTLDLFLSHCQEHLKTKVEEEAAPDA